MTTSPTAAIPLACTKTALTAKPLGPGSTPLMAKVFRPVTTGVDGPGSIARAGAQPFSRLST
jgi:hypothetical protein